jgi:hypothetical protein
MLSLADAPVTEGRVPAPDAAGHGLDEVREDPLPDGGPLVLGEDLLELTEVGPAATEAGAPVAVEGVEGDDLGTGPMDGRGDVLVVDDAPAQAVLPPDDDGPESAPLDQLDTGQETRPVVDRMAAPAGVGEDLDQGEALGLAEGPDGLLLGAQGPALRLLLGAYPDRILLGLTE